ncbi:type II toxin-antitoxin system CcdA family antitoxin [Sphingomonas sp. HMP6]|uniref:type II toxin-antitoxin system CcdA family antitoxin n=1 Tax=Sphingomonas sp. HMP6 TaxID=1517551 RepID=UPI0015969D17|nr:type II toxin-antitoxin system CcdA family antitoxin [Sphingomonas sp. HMP6]BCA57936.1 hypothetical protein HMP06_0705 [Sphingomonas sp. HMP6]
MAIRVSRRDEAPAIRRATNVSLDTKLVAAAKDYGINVSRACEEGLAKQISAERNRRWQEENKDAIEASNAWVEKHGLPLEKYRLF